MNSIVNDDKEGKYIFVTKSGSIYTLIIDYNKEKWLERNNEDKNLSLRRDSERIFVQSIICLEVGKSAVFLLEPLGLGNVTTRITSEVLDITMKEIFFDIGDYVEVSNVDKNYIGYIIDRYDNQLKDKEPKCNGKRFFYNVLIERNGTPVTTLENVAGNIRLLSKKNSLSAKALKLALDNHDGQLDLGENDYIYHVIQVGELVKQVTNKDEVLTVAYLHDILEDTQVTEETLKEIFPNEIVESVKALTREKYESYSSYLERVKMNKWATIVKLADLRHNSDLSRISNPTERDLKRNKKYRKAIEFLAEGE